MAGYIPRAIEPYVRDCSDHFGAIAVVGPRQVGKTTMLRRLAQLEARSGAPERSYVTLDDGDERRLAREDPKLFLPYLMRDIMEGRTVHDEGKFRRFMGACAAMTGQTLNYSLLAETADIDVKTASAWFSLLESSYVVRRVEAFSSNLISRLTKSPAIHFFDTGLACYLARWTSAEALAEGALNGHILETYSYLEIEKSWTCTYTKPDVSFLRTERGKKIDLVVTENGVSHPVEVKRTASPSPKDLRNFGVLEKVSPEAQGCVLCLADRALPITEKFWGFPIWAI